MTPEVLTVKLSKLNPDKKNARKHSERNIDEIARSIEKYGQHRPFVVQRGTERILVGNGMYEAMKKLGKQEGLVLYVEDDDATAARRALADNRTGELAEWDFDVLKDIVQELGPEPDVPGWSDKELEELLNAGDTSAEIIEDEAPEPPENPISKTGDLWILGKHRLLCGDSTLPEDVARLMNGVRARLTVTSPPYGVGKEYESNAFEDWERTIKGVIKAIAEYSLVICWNIGDLFKTDTQFIKPTGAYSINFMAECGFDVLYVRLWKKPGGNFGGVNPYHTVTMKPVQEYEYIFGFAKRDYKDAFEVIQKELAQEAQKANLDNDVLSNITGAKFMYGHWFTQHQWAMLDEKNYAKIQQYCQSCGIKAFELPYEIIRRKYDDLNVYQKTLTSSDMSEWGQWGIWEIQPVHERNGHPAAYPVELPRRCILMHSREGDVVLEPFGGSGTTLIACEQLDRKCYTMELDPKYCDVIIKRWQELTRQKAVHAETGENFN